MKSSGGRILGRTLFTVLFVIPVMLAVEIPVFLAGAALGTYLVLSRNLPEIPELLKYQPRTVSTFYADDGTVIGMFFKQKRFVVELQQIPPHAVKAFLAAEDSRFFEHSGVDWYGIGRATLRNLKARKVVQGGSTITMQVTRNFLLTRERSYSRKIREILLAGRLEKLWGKDRILRIYLNEIYLGDGCYGVEAAARNYFDKPVEHLSIAEAAAIAGLVASPNRYNPFKSMELAEARRRTVLERMLRAGFLTEEQYQKSLQEQLAFRKEITKPFDLVPDFTEVVRRQIIDKYGEERLYNEGLKVFTTCRVDYQQKALTALEKGLGEIKARHKNFEIISTVPKDQIPGLLETRATPALKPGRVYQGVVTKVGAEKTRTTLYLAFSKKLKGCVGLDGAVSTYKVGHVLAVHFDRFIDQTPYFTLDRDPQLQGALVAIENRTGYVRAIVGGASKENFQFNRATQAKRQPGSAFKPIIYASAVEKKSYSPATVIVDEPIVVGLPEKDKDWEPGNASEKFLGPDGLPRPGDWKPRNASGNFLGPVSFRRALELSRNICTVKLLMDLGLDEPIRMAKNMGISSRLGRNLSLSLGTSEVTLLELTSAYTVFPNSGIYVEPCLIKRVEDRFGNTLEDNTVVPVLDADQVPHPIPREEFRNLAEQGEFTDDDAETEQPGQAQTKHPDGSAPPGTDHPAQPNADGESQVKTPGQSPERKGPVSRLVRAPLSPETAYVMTNLLQGGVRSGTGARMEKYLKRKDIAGKTGTTNKAMDAWFIGFTPDCTAGVWVGFDEKRPLGRQEEGGRSALPIWGYFMQEVLAGTPDREFPVPPGISFVQMLTFAGNAREGFAPKTVEEPVYTPFAGQTLVVCPLDPPEVLNPYGGEQAGAQYWQAPQGAVPGPAAPYPPAVVQPLHPGPPAPVRPMEGRNLFPAEPLPTRPIPLTPPAAGGGASPQYQRGPAVSQRESEEGYRRPPPQPGPYQGAPLDLRPDEQPQVPHFNPGYDPPPSPIVQPGSLPRSGTNR